MQIKKRIKKQISIQFYQEGVLRVIKSFLHHNSNKRYQWIKWWITLLNKMKLQKKNEQYETNYKEIQDVALEQLIQIQVELIQPKKIPETKERRLQMIILNQKLYLINQRFEKDNNGSIFKKKKRREKNLEKDKNMLKENCQETDKKHIKKQYLLNQPDQLIQSLYGIK
ncbi:unnamed protein product [Paramecium sonneborni]|uniref:Uncharacterized protein n=1 Tax=Paramecium sonneborni TaxID=65129 RepID=A0A8S1RPD6_9CILI|nr:unnamed protein product [Paramecium sonneborni]